MRGDRLKELREKYGYGREKLAKLLDIGEANIPRYESGKNTPSSEVVVKMAMLFGVSSDYLLGLSDDPHGFLEMALSVQEQKIIHEIRHGDFGEAIKTLADELVKV